MAFDAILLEFVEEVSSYGFLEFLFLVIFEEGGVGVVPVGEFVKAWHSPTIVEGIIGFFPILDGVKNSSALRLVTFQPLLVGVVK